MFSDEQYSTSLAKLLSDFDYVIVDTCSLMDDAFPRWMDILHGAKDYLNDDLRIIVPGECYEELKKHSKNKEEAGKRIAAKSAIKIIRRAKWRKLLEVSKKESNKSFADHVIYVKASTDRLDKKILIITQDKKLATDLINLNNLSSQRGRRLKVFKIGIDGVLVPNFGETPYQGDKKGKPVLAKEKKLLFGGKQKPQEKPKKADPSNSDIISADSKLKSNIPNGNYPVEKKIEDLARQIEALSKLSPSSLSNLKLNYDLPALQKLSAQLKSDKTKKEKERQSAPSNPAPVVQESKPEPEKQEPKAKQPALKQSVIEEKPKQDKPKKPDLGWYEKGQTLKAAIVRVCEHHGVLVRNPDIPYDKQAHGEINFTQKDVDHVAELLENGVKGNDVFQSSYRNWPVAAQKVQDNLYKVWISFKSQPAEVKPAPAAEKKEPTQEKPAKKQQPKPKKEQPVAETKADEPKLEPKAKPVQPAEPNKDVADKPTKKPSQSKKAKQAKQTDKPKEPNQPKEADKVLPETTAEPQLVVGEPKKKAAKKAKPAESTPSQANQKPAKKKAATNDVKPEEKLVKAKPEEKPAKAKSSKKAADEKPAEKQPKTDKPSAKKQPEQSKEPAAKPAKAKPQQDAKAQAIAADKRLKANVNNPNYSGENKVKDIQAQIELVKKLTPEDRAQLNFDLDMLKAMLAMRQ